jgi:hypothetical protein
MLDTVEAELEEFYIMYYNFTRFEIPDFYSNSYTTNCKTLDPTVIVGHWYCILSTNLYQEWIA